MDGFSVVDSVVVNGVVIEIVLVIVDSTVVSTSFVLVGGGSVDVIIIGVCETTGNVNNVSGSEVETGSKFAGGGRIVNNGTVWGDISVGR